MAAEPVPEAAVQAQFFFFFPPFRPVLLGLPLLSLNGFPCNLRWHSVVLYCVSERTPLSPCFCCRWWQLPYYWVGIKLYDLVAGSNCLKSSYVLSKSRALEHFPMLQKDKLVGAIVYYDGM